MESSCLRLYELFNTSNGGNIKISHNLRRDQTISFLLRGLKHLSDGFQCLDASRPWLVYWIIHSLELLNVSVEGQQRIDIIKFLGIYIFSLFTYVHTLRSRITVYYGIIA